MINNWKLTWAHTHAIVSKRLIYITYADSAVSPLRTQTMALALSGCLLDNIPQRAITYIVNKKGQANNNTLGLSVYTKSALHIITWEILKT